MPDEKRVTLLQDALFTGPHAMGVDVPGTVFTALLRHASRVQFVSPPAPQQPLHAWLNERSSARTRPAAATDAPLFNPTSINEFNRS